LYLRDGDVYRGFLARILSLRLGYSYGDWSGCVAIAACGINRFGDLDGRDSRSNRKRSGLCDGGDRGVRMRMRADGGGLGDGRDARSNGKGSGLGHGRLWAGAGLNDGVSLRQSPSLRWEGCCKKKQKTG
jgi:hypothetical protein